MHLIWCLINVILKNGRSKVTQKAELVIQSHATLADWGAYCQKTSIKGAWSHEEESMHISIVHSIKGIKICNFNSLQGQKQFSRSPSKITDSCRDGWNVRNCSASQVQIFGGQRNVQNLWWMKCMKSANFLQSLNMNTAEFALSQL